jgi:hypothetical protein
MATFSGNEGTFYKIADAGALTAAWRSANPGALQGQFFGINNINTILKQGGCMGIRVYLGLDSSGNIQLILCGANAATNDMTSYILNSGVSCPPTCGTADALNS